MLLPFQVLAVVGAAAFAGLMLAIGIVLGGFWQSLPPADFLLWFEAHSPLVMRAVPLVVLPTIVGLAGATALSWNEPAARLWWLAAAGCIAIVLAMTFAYFFPINEGFASGAIPVEDVPARLSAWLSVHWIRIALALLAATCGLIAITR